MTAVRPRPELAPVSTATGPTIEQLADVARARRDAEDSIDTMVPCPSCASCPGCGGTHLVTVDRAAFLRSLEEPPPSAA